MLSIGYSAFNSSSGLISVNAGNPNYLAEDGILFNKTKTLLIACPTSKTGSYTIPSSVTSIGEAFENCRLNSVTIPSSVTSIASYTFFGCEGLKSIYANGTTPIDLNSKTEVFYDVNAITCTLYVPTGSLSSYQSANQWKNFSHIIEGNGFWLSVSVINLAATASSNATAAVHSNTTWTTTSNQTWLTVNPSTATTGDTTLTFTATANPTTDSRIATVTVSAAGVTPQTITITQAGAAITLSVSANTVSLGKEANSKDSVDVTSTTSWTAISNKTWLTVSPDSGAENGTLIFTAEANPANTTRQATVTVSATGATSKTITITQDAGTGTGLTTQTTELVSLYPNPVTDILYLSTVEGVKQIEIISIEGRVIANLMIINSRSINMSKLDKGIYLFHITTESGTLIKKIFKE